MMTFGSIKNYLESLWQNKPDDFKTLFGENPRSFWQQVSPDDPRLPYMEDVTAIEAWQDKCYPIILHGDGGVYTKKNSSSILTVSIKSMLSRSFAGNVIPCFCLPKHIRCLASFVLMMSLLTSRLGGSSLKQNAIKKVL